MKVQATSIPAAPALATSWWTVLCELAKIRLTSLVLLTTAVGLYMGAPGALDLALLLATVSGTGLVAAGAATLNQLWERNLDAQMHRTENRPLPSGRIRPETALWLGVLSAGAGLGLLAGWVNSLTCWLGAMTLVLYVLIYTPLKRVTPLNTLVGAMVGAIPPLMGWTAVRGELSSGGWSLFAILFFWQLPHFLAIAWLYREDYARAGFAMVSVLDPDGKRTARLALGHVIGLLFVSLTPVALQMTGRLYCVGACVLGLAFLGASWQFGRALSPSHARRLFYVSLIYLPGLFFLMVLDKVRL